MSTPILHNSNDNQNQNEFENIKHINHDQNEFWYARELQIALGYKNWRDFSNIIDKVKIACEKSNNHIFDHFVDTLKPIIGGKGAVQTIQDYQLSRYTCYLRYTFRALEEESHLVENPSRICCLEVSMSLRSCIVRLISSKYVPLSLATKNSTA